LNRSRKYRRDHPPELRPRKVRCQGARRARQGLLGTCRLAEFGLCSSKTDGPSAGARFPFRAVSRPLPLSIAPTGPMPLLLIGASCGEPDPLFRAMPSCALDIATKTRAAIGKMTFRDFDRGKLGTNLVRRPLRSAAERPPSHGPRG
jgi:hypothetical protein